MTACCPGIDPVVFGHLSPRCPATARPPGGYRETKPCDCPDCDALFADVSAAADPVAAPFAWARLLQLARSGRG